MAASVPYVSVQESNRSSLLRRDQDHTSVYSSSFLTGSKPIIGTLSPREDKRSSVPVASEGYGTPSRVRDNVGDSIIKKQQREMELLIRELKDRDKELNFMVRSHQQQLDLWAQDRSRIQALEHKCTELEDTLRRKEQEIVLLKANVSKHSSQGVYSAAEIKRLNREHQLEHAKLERSSLQLANAEAKLSRAEAQERSLQVMLKEKDGELNALSQKLEDVQTLLDVRVKEIKCDETKLKEQVTMLTLEKEKERHSSQCLQGELLEYKHQNEQMSFELSRTRDELDVLKKHLQVAYDSEKRKEQLLMLQRSKLERYDTELVSMRKVYSQQQQEISTPNKQLLDVSSRSNLSTPTRVQRKSITSNRTVKH